MPTAVPALYVRSTARRPARSEGVALMLLVSLLPFALAIFVTAATHQGRVTQEGLRATISAAGMAMAAAESPQL
ncbi:MAG: hypothetical protein JOZ16_01995 [Methylobacteriaceae bacterium]|nr:hypothetical protein [Methylobacteriaceae bacterium]